MKAPDFQIHDGILYISPGEILSSSRHFDAQSNNYYNSPTKSKIFPIFGPDTRRKLGIPDPDSEEFRKVVNDINISDMHAAFITRLPNTSGNLIITTNIVKKNSYVHTRKPNSNASNNRIIRVVSQATKAEEGSIVSQTFSGPDQLMVPVQSGNFDEIFVRVLDEYTFKEVKCKSPITVTLSFHKPNQGITRADRTLRLIPKSNESAVAIAKAPFEPYAVHTPPSRERRLLKANPTKYSITRVWSWPSMLRLKD